MRVKGFFKSEQVGERFNIVASFEDNLTSISSFRLESDDW